MKLSSNVFWLNVKFMETPLLTDLLHKSSNLDQETVLLLGKSFVVLDYHKLAYSMLQYAYCSHK